MLRLCVVYACTYCSHVCVTVACTNRTFRRVMDNGHGRGMDSGWRLSWLHRGVLCVRTMGRAYYSYTTGDGRHVRFLTHAAPALV